MFYFNVISDVIWRRKKHIAPTPACTIVLTFVSSWLYEEYIINCLKLGVTNKRITTCFYPDTPAYGQKALKIPLLPSAAGLLENPMIPVLFKCIEGMPSCLHRGIQLLSVLCIREFNFGSLDVRSNLDLKEHSLFIDHIAITPATI